MRIRSGTCKKCGLAFKVRSKYNFIVEFKFNLWLFNHYKKVHKINIIKSILINKLKQYKVKEKFHV